MSQTQEPKWSITLPPKPDRLAMFATEHWSVKLAAFALDTLVLMVKWGSLAFAVVAWKLWL